MAYAETRPPAAARSAALPHGGNLFLASQTYGIPVAEWLDLSTGINPRAYPIDALSSWDFQRMPYVSAEFDAARTAYYGSHAGLAINGSQQAIQLLPRLLPALPVWVPEAGYQEHRRHWSLQGNRVVTYPAFCAEQAAQVIAQALRTQPPFHLLVINPNNPTGLCFTPQQLRHWASRMAQGAMLIVDEAFIDAAPGQSVLAEPLPDNMLVLRSFGKYFGLAGLRLGFVFGAPRVIDALGEWVGPWEVNGPAQSIATAALRDTPWHHETQHFLQANAQANRVVFDELFASLPVMFQAHTPLFSTYSLTPARARHIYEYFARRGILLRLIELNDQQALLRTGRLNYQHTSHLQQLQQACAGYCNELNRYQRGKTHA